MLILKCKTYKQLNRNNFNIIKALKPKLCKMFPSDMSTELEKDPQQCKIFNVREIESL